MDSILLRELPPLEDADAVRTFLIPYILEERRLKLDLLQILELNNYILLLCFFLKSKLNMKFSVMAYSYLPPMIRG